ALERRRRAAQHAHCTGEPCPDDGQLACVVARRFRLLVARLVLLVHDDRTEVRDRREDGRARTDRDATLAAAESAPRVVALTVRQRGGQDGDDVTELCAEAGNRLRRERDLRYQ